MADDVLPAQQGLDQYQRVGIGVVAVAAGRPAVLAVDPGCAAFQGQVRQQRGQPLRSLLRGRQLALLGGGIGHVMPQGLLVGLVQVAGLYGAGADQRQYQHR
ncbi:hypothetical protein D3C79_845370 [compost metagenome]